MSQYWILVAIILPILGGIGIPLLPFRKRGQLLLYIEAVTLLTSAVVGALILGGTTRAFHVVRFVNELSISFRIDGMAMVFAGLVAVLWPLATLYAFEYMTHEKHERSFFMFYTMTYGVTLGIAFASDILGKIVNFIFDVQTHSITSPNNRVFKSLAKPSSVMPSMPTGFVPIA